MPLPRKKENINDYLGRCIPEVRKEGHSQKEAQGKCFGMFRHYKKKRQFV
jgi:hypothetical protein